MDNELANIKTLGKKIAWLMRNRPEPISQVGLAAAVGVTPVWINNLVRDKRVPSDELLSKIAKFFGVTPVSLFDDKRRKSLGI